MTAVVARCKRTGNPVGTDTWGNGSHCRCAPCVDDMRQAVPRVTDAEWAEVRKMKHETDAQPPRLAKLLRRHS